MARLKRRARHAAAICGLVLLSAASAAAQQSPAPQPPLPFAPDWALLAGWDVYAKKGCGQCHGIRSGSEGRAAPDLARIASGTGFFELGAAMWNHLPLMGAKMREKGDSRGSCCIFRRIRAFSDRKNPSVAIPTQRPAVGRDEVSKACLRAEARAEVG